MFFGLFLQRYSRGFFATGAAMLIIANFLPWATFYDSTGSFSVYLFGFGVELALCGILLLAITMYRKWPNRGTVVGLIVTAWFVVEYIRVNMFFFESPDPGTDIETGFFVMMLGVFFLFFSSLGILRFIYPVEPDDSMTT